VDFLAGAVAFCCFGVAVASLPGNGDAALEGWHEAGRIWLIVVPGEAFTRRVATKAGALSLLVPGPVAPAMGR
jgi:hypothetical protein